MLSAVAGVHADAGCARQIEEQRRIRRRLRAESQHFVVTGALTLARQSGGRVPDERVEPVDRARQLRDRLRAAIAALDVRQLVHERRLPRFSGPGQRPTAASSPPTEEAGDVRARFASQLPAPRSATSIPSAARASGLRSTRSPGPPSILSTQTSRSRTQQNKNHATTAANVPNVPIVPSVPKASFCWVAQVRDRGTSEQRSERCPVEPLEPVEPVEP